MRLAKALVLRVRNFWTTFSFKQLDEVNKIELIDMTIWNLCDLGSVLENAQCYTRRTSYRNFFYSDMKKKMQKLCKCNFRLQSEKLLFILSLFLLFCRTKKFSNDVTVEPDHRETNCFDGDFFLRKQRNNISETNMFVPRQKQLAIYLEFSPNTWVT